MTNSRCSPSISRHQIPSPTKRAYSVTPANQTFVFAIPTAQIALKSWISIYRDCNCEDCSLKLDFVQPRLMYNTHFLLVSRVTSFFSRTTTGALPRASLMRFTSCESHQLPLNLVCHDSKIGEPVAFEKKKYSMSNKIHSVCIAFCFILQVPRNSLAG